ncbi:XRE family transcriptional regulator [Mucilaginibacter conchicola]|uniref:XRE family transcriptional regulator n=1 Tax=Mucilaginibacter conchicola TaxID=2303333 RepID=A0A372NQH4_9SPHI|nr:helix-turn-helix transcriptional regulator [Mucilaginibacter conchicola]RFZ91108.1 XRE family transcriptional regulator [Mucilaginibacter conchicola]
MANEVSKEYLLKFGIHLKSLRQSKGLSLRQLAAKCNIEHADITRYEKGEINMSFNSIVELSVGLEMTLKELMDFQL